MKIRQKLADHAMKKMTGAKTDNFKNALKEVLEQINRIEEKLDQLLEKNQK